MTRYFESRESGQIFEVEQSAEFQSNTHVLVDPNNPTSGPLPGWTEVTKAELDAAIKNFADQRKADAKVKKGVAVSASKKLQALGLTADECHALGLP